MRDLSHSILIERTKERPHSHDIDKGYAHWKMTAKENGWKFVSTPWCEPIYM